MNPMYNGNRRTSRSSLPGISTVLCLILTMLAAVIVSRPLTAAPTNQDVPVCNSATAATRIVTTDGGITRLFKATYSDKHWSGELVAYTYAADTRQLIPVARAQDRLAVQAASNNREIITMKADDETTQGGIAFRWPALSAWQQARLDGDDGQGKKRLCYLRGNSTLEGTAFRDRAGVLGDIIHSSPVYVGAPAAPYSRKPGYAAFRNQHIRRTAMIYVGANDGMLHAFRADTLREVFAYVPAGVYADLEKLSDPGYQHQYYVDGTPTVADVRFGHDSDWRTVLVGTTGFGGPTLFALDVTKPDSISENDAAATVLWEVSPTLDSNYADLGYTVSRPAIVKMNNGAWAVVFGNGSGSAQGRAVLYIAAIASGALIHKIVLDEGPGNGLSTPAVVDIDADGSADRIYAGDLQGNLWAIDVSSTKPARWQSAIGTPDTPQPLFTGMADQPVGISPVITRHPAGDYIVIFPTGQNMVAKDAGAMSTQSLYGIYDNVSHAAVGGITRADLVKQTITEHPSGFGQTIRTVTGRPVAYSQGRNRGWFIDFDIADAEGERIVNKPILRNNKLVFTTTIPAQPPCVDNTDGWLMAVSPLTGGRLAYSPFDLNGDNVIHAADRIETATGSSLPATGIQPLPGAPATPAFVADPDSGQPLMLVTDGQGHLRAVPTRNANHVTGRLSWQQLQSTIEQVAADDSATTNPHGQK